MSDYVESAIPEGYEDATPTAIKHDFVVEPELTGVFVSVKDCLDKTENPPKPYRKYFFETEQGLEMTGEPGILREAMRLLQPGQAVKMISTGESIPNKRKGFAATKIFKLYIKR